MSDTEPIWPDALELEDEVEFQGEAWVVVGTGPGTATLRSFERENAEMEVFRWAFTDQVGIEIESPHSQDEFGDMVTKANS